MESRPGSQASSPGEVPGGPPRSKPKRRPPPPGGPPPAYGVDGYGSGYISSAASVASGAQLRDEDDGGFASARGGAGDGAQRPEYSLPGGMTQREDTQLNMTIGGIRGRPPVARPHRPGDPPPVEAFGDLPPGMTAPVPGRRRWGRSSSPLKQAVNFEAPPERAAPPPADDLQDAEEKKEEAPVAPLAPATPPKEESAGSNKVATPDNDGAFSPPPPPQQPPGPVPFSSSIIPRGRIDLRISRVVGVGPGTGGVNSGGATPWGGAPGSAGSNPPGSAGGGRPGTNNSQRGVTTPLSRMNARSKGNVYMLFELNLGTQRVPAKSNTYKNVRIADFMTKDCLLKFNILDGTPAPRWTDDMTSDEKAALPPLLFYSVWQPGRFSDHLLAEGCIPASYLFKQRAAVGTYLDITLPLQAPKGKGVVPELSAGITAYMIAGWHFTPSCSGVLSVTVHEGRDLIQRELIGKADPYVLVAQGSNKCKGLAVQEGGSNPFFNDEEMLIWIDHRSSVAQDALGTISFDVFDEEKFLRDEHMGGARVALAPWLSDFEAHDEVVELQNKKGMPAGRITLTRKFYPAGEMTVRVVEGRNVAASDASGGSDAYVNLRLEGRALTYEVTTGVDASGGENPVWDETFVFDVVDHCELRLGLWDKDKFTADDLVGEVIVDLEQLYRYGVRDAWVPLKYKGDWGGFEDRGEVRIETDFFAPRGVAYPQLRPDKDKYDDKERRRRGGPSDEELEAAAELQKQRDAEIAAERERAMKELAGADFTDKEIEEAFKFIDLDRNLYIGVTELRHVLTCMGELITDLELDEMVHMCDADGDGQVAFFEFYQMAKADNPSDPVWQPKGEAEFNAMAKAEAAAKGGVAGGAGVPLPPPVTIKGADGRVLQVIEASNDPDARRKAMLRAQEMASKAEKKRVGEAFVKEHNMRLAELQTIFRRFQAHPSFTSGASTYEEFCEIFDLQHTNEHREIFSLFLDPKAQRSDVKGGLMNVREFLLALNNFTKCTKPQRINFAFFLFDADGSGSINDDELTCILKANHLSNDEAAVRKKAENILSAADRDGSRSIDLEEFVVLAHRFPHLLFPDYNASSDELMKKGAQTVTDKY